MPGPTHIGAIDAGSNALRVVVAEVASDGAAPRTLEGYRVPVRLGHNAFTVGALDIHTIDEAVSAFRGFRQLFDQHGVQHYRAVTTSAVRSSRNRDILLHRIYAETGIELEVITGEEEARLIRKAVRNAFRSRPAPAAVFDLGGGSLEVNIRNVSRWTAASLPIGTVRLAETLGLYGTIGEDEARMVRRYVTTLLHVFSPNRNGETFEPTVACGGNPERFSKMMGGEEGGMPYVDIAAIEKVLPQILSADVPTRMHRWNVRRDRAEVMGVAGLVLVTCARELGVERVWVPGVGLRDALLFEIGATLPERREQASSSRAKALLTAARMFAARVGHDTTHGEKVRRLARSLFDQLSDLHELPHDLRVVLEAAALLHDVGEVIHTRSHHKHGEYMVRWGRIHGLESPAREMVATLIRTHRKSPPTPRKHELYAAMDDEQRTQVRKMLGMLRLADGLDTDHRQRVRKVAVTTDKNTIDLAITLSDRDPVDTDVLLRKAEILAAELDRQVTCQITR